MSNQTSPRKRVNSKVPLHLQSGHLQKWSLLWSGPLGITEWSDRVLSKNALLRHGQK